MTTMTTNDRPTIMEKLKSFTQSLHDATEDGQFNQDLVKGILPRDRYVEMLAQLYLIHQALEGQLRCRAGSTAAIGTVLRDYQYQEPYLATDLAFFGRDPSKSEALATTKRLIDQINEVAAQKPAGLLGMQYVFEGSNNGSKFIAKAVRRAYQLDSEGTRYLDPYGENQRAYWQQFKDDMNAAEFSTSEADAIQQAAATTFEGVMRLHQELHQLPVKSEPKAASPGAPKCPFHAAMR
jgi:heme oxygenase